MSAKTKYYINFSKLEDKKIRKIIDDENSAEAVRNRLKQARNNGSEIIQLMK